MKRLCLLVAGLMLCAGMVYAVDWGDGFTVTVTPAGDRGVVIDTTSIAVSLTMGTTLQIADAIPVRSTGTLAPLEYTLQGTDSMGAWSFSADGATGANILAVQALFGATLPAFGVFEGTDPTVNLVTGAAAEVGDGAPGKYEVGGGPDMDDLALNVTRYLWLQLKAPTSTSSGSVQNFSITVTAEPAD